MFGSALVNTCSCDVDMVRRRGSEKSVTEVVEDHFEERVEEVKEAEARSK